MYLGNTEYRAVGFNAYQLFRWYARIDPAPDARTDAPAYARRMMMDLRADGSFLLRVAGPITADEFRGAFFDHDPRPQAAKRAAFYEAMHEMLADARTFGHRVVYSLVWTLPAFADLGGHSLHTLVTDPTSPGRRMLDEYLFDVAGHFSNEPGIAFWETDNESDLYADRGLGNFTSEELAGFYAAMIATIKSADQNHLVSTGASEEAVAHVSRTGSPEAHARHMIEEQAAADMISVHFYHNSSLPLRWYAAVAQRAGKPLYIGEIGTEFERNAKTGVLSGAEYGSPKAIADLRHKLRAIRHNAVSIALWWNLNGMANDQSFDLDPARTPSAFQLITHAGRAAQKRRHQLPCLWQKESAHVGVRSP